MRYDLHLHTCLSPCADREMTPATVAGLAKLAGAGLIAVTDHNSALNLPAVEKACRAYGVRLLPGLEVTCAEEVHLLCYFKSLSPVCIIHFRQGIYGVGSIIFHIIESCCKC